MPTYTEQIGTLSDYSNANGTMSASSEYDTVFWQAWKSGDKATGTAWSNANAEGNHGWVQFVLASAKKIEKYSLWLATYNQNPTAWVLKGSNDGSSWDTLDSRTKTSEPVGMNEYMVTSPGTYTYYRLEMTSGGTNVVLYEWDLYTTDNAINSMLCLVP